jgi:hypothetical protein
MNPYYRDEKIPMRRGGVRMQKFLLFVSALFLATSVLADNSAPVAANTLQPPSSPLTYRDLCPVVGRSALELANARDRGIDIATASDYVRNNLQSLGLSTPDERINHIVLVLIPGNAALAYQRKDLKPVTIRYAAAGVCAIQSTGDRNPNHIVAIVDGAAKCQSSLEPGLDERALISCIAAEVTNIWAASMKH